ncbi:MAG: carboxypeptidase regulatory-like domain-containing protein [Candidatus Acidiferrales bacterium]
MRRLIRVCSILAAALLFATIAAAQMTSVSGQIIDLDGKPWANIDVIIQNTSNGQTFDAKTDKDGRYTQLGLPPGSYKLTVQSEPDETGHRFMYSEMHSFQGGQDNEVSINFEKLKQAAHPDQEKEKEAQNEANKKFNNMKAEFNAGVAAMDDASTLRAQLATTPTADKGPIQDKLNADYKTAIGDFQQAEQADSPTDVKNQAMFWNDLGVAYEYAGQYDNSIDAYQKAISLQPQAPYYLSLSKVQASAALTQTDPNATQQKLADAGATCDKATALDPTAAARCWKNIGIILSNKGDMKDAITPLQKTTQLDPKDAQAWFLLGSALAATAESKQVGNQVTTVFPPGTAEAFQKCIDADPTGPYASQAKEVLDGLASLTAGENTSDKKKK